MKPRKPSLNTSARCIALAAILPLSTLLCCGWSASDRGTVSVQIAGQTPLFKMDQPFLFSYGSWEKKARIENGTVLLNVEGITPKGGAGVNANLDLTGHAQDTPVIQVQVGPKNTLKRLRLMLKDTAGRSGTWAFDLPTTAGTAVVIALDGASLSRPNETEKSGPPSLANIMQWQLLGDWGGDGPVDLQITGIACMSPDEKIRQARTGREARDRAEAEKAAEERAELRARYAARTAQSPQIQTVYAAAPDILALQIHTGTITPGRLTPYTPQPGDEKREDGGKTHLIRGGKDLGYLIGTRKDALFTFEGFSGDPLLAAEADDAANFKITSPDDPTFAAGVAPQRVMRKSKPDDWQQPTQPGICVRHNLYLKLPHALTPGKTYQVTVGNVNTQQTQVRFVFDAARAWTESIHVNQVGFRPDDPIKHGFLSLWMGASGGYDFPAGIRFYLVDATTGKRVYNGVAGTAWPADKPEFNGNTRNFNSAGVTPLDFSGFKTPGRYRIEVEGVGVSYPFEIGPTVWEKAFVVQMKGFYHQRSGIDLGPPYTTFVKPADFRPEKNDPAPITQSTYSVLDGGDGFKGLAAGDTGKPVPEAWGGYQDAGDWNPRRITHMRTTTLWQLELLEMFPDYFGSVKLNIPNDAPGPDLLKECLFELSLFHRLQQPDGGVRHGIETNGDPSPGEVSWKQSMPAYVYAVDPLSSYLYTQVAARAANVLERYDPALANVYRNSAVKAMRWAENDRVRRISAGTWEKASSNWGGDAAADRALAAASLYCATRDARWYKIFLEDTTLNKPNATAPFYGNTVARDTAFTVARHPEIFTDPQIQKNARQALVSDADGALAFAKNNAFGIASDDPGRPQFLGFFSIPHGAVSLVRAYHLTHDPKYLSGAVQACLFPAGANPGNLVFTTGVGANPVRHTLKLDAIGIGQPVPAGMTPYGIVDLQKWQESWITWPFTYFLGKCTQPAPTEWPTTESYFDVRMMPALNEYTMDQTMGPNAYVWGYLAARK